MSINFPSSIDVLSNPTGSDLLENATAALDHDVQHSNANDAIEALEAKVGANSSAVTTSHDYKLSAVTATAKALTSGTSTQTVSGLTLTSPQVNFGSDANGDLIIRNGSGVTSRLAIGTTDQILAVQSGLPTWVANPSATAASDTVAGIIELATTAETETGTATNRAVTPDGLHDMTTLAGAAWFLDEDTMSSDSAVKTASQQSIKAYVDTSNLFSQGQTSRASGAGDGDITIAHGLGKVPKFVRISAFASGGANLISNGSVGTATSTSNETCTHWSNSGASYTVAQDSTHIIFLDAGTGTEEWAATLTTLDSTNIVLTTDITGSAGTLYIQWEAYA